MQDSSGVGQPDLRRVNSHQVPSTLNRRSVSMPFASDVVHPTIKRTSTSSTVVRSFSGLFGSTKVPDDIEMSPQSSGGSLLGILDVRQLIEARAELRKVLTGFCDPEETVEATDYDAYVDWYMRWLDDKLENLAPIPFSSFIVRSQLKRKPEQLLRYKYLTIVASTVKQKPAFTIRDVVQALEEQHIIWRSTIIEPNTNHLVFVTVSWLTMLYKPVMKPKNGVFAIEQPKPRQILGARAREMREQSHVLANHQFTTLLHAFSHEVVPKRTVQVSNAGRQTELLNASNVSYYHLSRILGIQVELVDVLGEHLEFDESKFRLKIFRFPSFCRVLFAQGDSQSLLCQLFDDNSARDDESIVEQNEPLTDSQAVRLCRELLITYLVIFIQDRHARARSSAHWRKGKYGNSLEPGPLDDPLLPQLLGQNPHIVDTLYQEVLGFETRTQYEISRHFQFFGSRLQRLNQFSEQQSLADWRLLLWDRRDIHKRLGYWVAIGTLLFSIVSSIVQSVLAGLQLEAQKQQGICSCS